MCHVYIHGTPYQLENLVIRVESKFSSLLSNVLCITTRNGIATFPWRVCIVHVKPPRMRALIILCLTKSRVSRPVVRTFGVFFFHPIFFLPSFLDNRIVTHLAIGPTIRHLRRNTGGYITIGATQESLWFACLLACWHKVCRRVYVKKTCLLELTNIYALLFSPFYFIRNSLLRNLEPELLFASYSVTLNTQSHT